MRVFILGIMLFSGFFSLSHAGEVLRKYIDPADLYFQDGHFKVHVRGKLLRLKTLRANNGGIYFIPKDICTKKSIHRGHG